MPFDDVLGTGSLPPGFDPGVPGPAGWMPSGDASPNVGDYATPAAGPAPGLDVALRPPASAAPSPAGAAPGAGGIDLQQILGLQQPQGVLSPNSQFMTALGAGLSSAGQNWNKSALAAFAGGAGAAIQGGQAFAQQQQKNRQALVNLALHAWQIGDMATYRRAIVNLRAANARNRAPAPAAPPAPPAISPETREPSSAAPAPTPSGDAAASPAHRIALERMFADAGVPSTRVDAADVERAAALMAAKALPPAEAFEVASIHNAIDAGHVSPNEVDLIYGPGAADAIHRTATS